jgi:hypothetical protein
MLLSHGAFSIETDIPRNAHCIKMDDAAIAAEIQCVVRDDDELYSQI